MAQKTIVVSEGSRFIGWTVFSVFQVELRRWLSDDDPDLQQGLQALERALRLLIMGLKPTKAALRLTTRGSRPGLRGPLRR
jgi:hypothetical protein